jgi:hypothetical protein
VQLSAGSHVASFEFMPLSVYVGGTFSLLGLVALAVLVWAQRRA